MKKQPQPPKQPQPKAPEHVALIGMGPSSAQYGNIVKRLGARTAFADEVWTINAMADVYVSDRVFHMDDMRTQEIRAAAAPESNIAAMLGMMKRHAGPIYTSIAHADYPATVPFPLQDVIDSTGYAYFNSTAAYPVALAIHLGVKKLTIFGCDYTYANAHHAEAGRACMEFWLGFAAARGMQLSVPRESSLMDACNAFADRLYGYDHVDVALVPRDGGGLDVRMKARDKVPTAAEFEERYDHSKHPNPLVSD